MQRLWMVFLFACDGASTRPADPLPGVAEDVMTGLRDPHSVAIDATHVYFAHDDGAIARIPSAPGGTIEPIATGQRGPGAIDVTTGRVCWLNSGTHSADFRDGSVHCAAKSGGVDQRLSDAYMPSSLVIDGNALYWSELDGQAVRSVDLDGQNPRTLDNSNTAKVDLAIAGAKLAWTASGDQADVVVMDLVTTAKRVVSTAEYSPDTVLFDGDDVIWISEQTFQSDGAVRISRAGGAPVDLIGGETYARELIRVGDALYWISDKRIRTAPLYGGNAITLAEADESVGSLASDGTYLYWTELYRGAIVRIAR